MNGAALRNGKPANNYAAVKPQASLMAVYLIIPREFLQIG
jgi:hypothetical protein